MIPKIADCPFIKYLLLALIISTTFIALIKPAARLRFAINAKTSRFCINPSPAHGGSFQALFHKEFLTNLHQIETSMIPY